VTAAPAPAAPQHPIAVQPAQRGAGRVDAMRGVAILLVAVVTTPAPRLRLRAPYDARGWAGADAPGLPRDPRPSCTSACRGMRSSFSPASHQQLSGARALVRGEPPVPSLGRFFARASGESPALWNRLAMFAAAPPGRTRSAGPRQAPPPGAAKSRSTRHAAHARRDGVLSIQPGRLVAGPEEQCSTRLPAAERTRSSASGHGAMMRWRSQCRWPWRATLLVLVHDGGKTSWCECWCTACSCPRWYGPGSCGC